MKAIIKAIVFFSVLLASSNTRAQKPVKPVNTKTEKPYPGAIIVTDTITEGWMEAAPGKMYATYLLIDNKGTIYSQVSAPGEDYNYCFLENGVWKNPGPEFNIKIKGWLLDKKGNAYAKSVGSELFRKTGNKWMKVAGDTTTLREQSIEADGKHYGFKILTTGSFKYEMVKWENNTWLPLETMNGSLRFNDLPDYAVDKKGVVYFSTSDNQKSNIVQVLSEKVVTETASMPDKIIFLEADEDGNVYLVWGFGKNIIKKWDGSSWVDIAAPGGLSKYVSPNIEQNFGKIWLTSLTEDPKYAKGERLSFNLIKGTWVFVGAYNAKFSIYPPLISNGVMYALSRSTDILMKYEKGSIVKREIYPFAFKDGLTRPAELNTLLADLRMIRKGNKFGIINKKGEVLIHAAADKILIDKNPYGNASGFAYHLIIDGKDYYTTLNNSKTDPAKLPMAFEEKFNQCNKCKGKGRFEGATVYKEKKGDWVPPKTVTVRKLRSSGGYYDETTTTPGYYKPSKTVSDGKTSATDCSDCKGKGGFTSGWREYLEYNTKANGYTATRKVIE